MLGAVQLSGIVVNRLVEQVMKLLLVATSNHKQEAAKQAVLRLVLMCSSVSLHTICTAQLFSMLSARDLS